MQRRGFLRNIGFGASALALPHSSYGNDQKVLSQQIPNYQYPLPNTLTDALSDEGFLTICISLSASNDSGLALPVQGSLSLNGGSLARVKPYFFHEEYDFFEVSKNTFSCKTDFYSPHFIVIWIKNPDQNSQVSIIVNDLTKTFALSELFPKHEITWSAGEILVKANILLYNEIGPIQLNRLGIKNDLNEFEFVVMADPQGGDPTVEENGKLMTRMKIHNAFIEESIELTNQLEINPLFVIVVGDIVDGWGREEDFRQLNTFLKRLKSPVLYTIGNHESKHKLNFGPGYNMDGFANYFAAQKDMNGLEKILYSFNIGEWHFVVWPDPLREGFWESHPHYFDWLERDLYMNQNRPTMVFQHVPVHPIGINPHIEYAESVYVKRTFLDTLSKYGNVKLVLSGHVHIPIKAAFKTACTMRGISFINLPATGYRPRNFGEEDLNDGISQGVTLVKIQGSGIRITYKSLTEDEYVFPDELPELNLDTYQLWLKYKYELPAEEMVINGNFEQGLKGWTPRWIYTEDNDPANICETKPMFENAKNSLYIFNRKRRFATAGQDRLPQDMNRICQAIKVNPSDKPLVSLRYMIDGKHSDFNGLCGAYVWVEGFVGNIKRVNLVYSANKIWYNIGGRYENPKFCAPVMLDLNNTPDLWHEAYLNIAEDHNRFDKGNRYELLKIDRIVINLGVWNINYGSDQPFAIWFDDIQLQHQSTMLSNINGQLLTEKPNEMVWWQGKFSPFKNIGGDHRLFLTTNVNYLKKDNNLK